MQFYHFQNVYYFKFDENVYAIHCLLNVAFQHLIKKTSDGKYIMYIVPTLKYIYYSF